MKKYIQPILEKLHKYHRKNKDKDNRIPLYIEPPIFEDGRATGQEKPGSAKRGITIIDFNIDSNGVEDE